MDAALSSARAAVRVFVDRPCTRGLATQHPRRTRAEIFGDVPHDANVTPVPRGLDGLGSHSDRLSVEFRVFDVADLPRRAVLVHAAGFTDSLCWFELSGKASLELFQEGVFLR